MALNDINRVRIIMDLIKDGDVADEGAYVGVDLFDGSRADTWIASFYAAYGPLHDGEGAPIPYESLSNAQKASFYMDQQIEFHRQARIAAELRLAQAAAAAATRAAIDSDITTDFGA